MREPTHARHTASLVALIFFIFPLLLKAADPATKDAAAPAIELGAPFADDAILQRGMKVPVWGWSIPGTKVTVQFAGQTKTAVADDRKGPASADGLALRRWMVKLDPLKASYKPAEMVIAESTGKKVVLKGILVGEVWLASGQSNMNRPVHRSTCSQLGTPAKAQLAPIRQCNLIGASPSLHPVKRGKGRWSKERGSHNAISYGFAHRLHEELNVPIGIIHCAVGETTIRAWVPRCGFAAGKDEYTKKIYEGLLETDPTTPEHRKAWDEFYRATENTLADNKKRVDRGEKPTPISTRLPGNMGSTRDSTWMFNGKLRPMIPYAIRGAIWNQGYHSAGEGFVYYNNLHSLVRGWRKEWGRPDLPVYFHQFYTPGEGSLHPTIGGAADMRLGTWLAREIPNADMASQIDIGGGIHYGNKAIPAERFALLALKNQYPSTTLKAGGKAKDLVVHGPMFKSYKVVGNKVIVAFDNAKGGLVVGDTATNAKARKIAHPTIIENGDDRVKLFYLAGEDRVWHPATMKIDGETVIVTSPAVPKPRGISYASGGVAWRPNLYNRALLPTTPFIYYDQKLVTSETWPGGRHLKIAGKTRAPGTFGLLHEWRKMPILSVQFRDNAVLQADTPVTIWGSTQMHGEWGGPAEGKAVIHFEFGDTKKTIPVTEGMDEWEVTLPPMKAGPKPYKLKVSFTVDGKLAHERSATNIVFGDVWYVAVPVGKFMASAAKPSGQIVRTIQNQSKRDRSSKPSRFSICVSRTPKTRFSSYWKPANGLAGALGHSIAAKTGRPVGIIFMQLKRDNPPLKNWIPSASLNQAPSLMADFKQLKSTQPGNKYYDANVKRYLADWKRYWSRYIPQVIETSAWPEEAGWGRGFPALAANVSTSASTTYHVYTHSFTPASLKGVIFLNYLELFKDGRANDFGPEMTALANSWKARFGKPDPHFIYTVPGKALVSKYTVPRGISGKSSAVEIGNWSELNNVIRQVVKTAANP